MWFQHLDKQKMKSRYNRRRILDYPLIGLTDYTPKWALWEGNETWPTALVCPYRSTLFFVETLPKIHSFLTVCKEWHRLQWPSLKRLLTAATVWVVRRVSAMLKKIWKHKPLHRRRNFDVVEFTAYKFVFETWQPFLFHHINEIINSTGESLSHSSASHELPYL